ncbi:hypothetical protein NMY22_g8075 [Coprinellus aureogranulatus]|nr:hypothetical protein NMY22_g8075 [Coprinellus aureogranulatus]
MVEHEDTIFAPLYWGFVLSIFLGGMTVVQAHVYFPAKKDRPFMRVTVSPDGIRRYFTKSHASRDVQAALMLLGSVLGVLLSDTDGNLGRLTQIQSLVTPQFSAECLISALITFISQLYFVHQLVVVKRSGKGSWIIIGPISFFSVLAAIGGIGCVSSMYVWDTAVLAFRNKTFAVFFGLAKGFSAITDILATMAMCLFLTGQKGELEKTQTLVSQVVVFVIQRGILVTTIQAAVLIAFFAAPSNLAWLALHMNVTRLYANTFFAMLNGRSNLRDKHNGTIVSNFNSSHSRGQTASHHRPDNINLDHHFNLNRNLSHDAEPDWAVEKNHIQLPVVTKTVVVSNI